MESFRYQALPSRVLFGSGTSAQVGEELAVLGVRRALLLCTGSRGARVRTVHDHLGALAAGVFDQAAEHTPVDVTERALDVVARLEADGVVAVGGGSTIGLGKAIALRTDLPQVVVPTTYSGSEVTPVLGQTEDGHKSTLRSDKVLPETVIYDVDLTMSLPAGVSAASGVNALAHAIEALWSRERNPVTTLLARESITALTSALPDVCDRPDDRPARSDALYGAWLAGICLATVGMALHHKLCHVLGGAFDLPHAQTHAVLLPYVVAFNAGSAPSALSDLQDVLGRPDAAAALRELTGRLGLPRSLADLGMPEDGIAHAADLAARDPYWNPRPVDRAALAALIRQAWSGSAPVPIAN